MAKATVTIIEEGHETFSGRPERYERTVTGELPKGMKVIGPREKCAHWDEHYEPDWVMCTKSFRHNVRKRHCPCHNWKPRKEK